MELIVVLVWGGIPVAAWAIAFRHRIASHRLHHDRRSRRELLAVLGLLIAALCSAISIVSIVIVPPGPEWRRILAGIAYGAFAAAGVVFAAESSAERDG